MCEMQLPSKVILGSTKVIDFGTIRKRVFDFLLVINSNLCRILHRFVPTPPLFNAIVLGDRLRISGWTWYLHKLESYGSPKILVYWHQI